MLFDKIASIPLMENRERATTVFKTVFSNKFLKAFGDWRKRVPINKQAYNKVNPTSILSQKPTEKGCWIRLLR